MSIRQSYAISSGGKYDLGNLPGRLGAIRVVDVLVNGKNIRYSPKMTWLESGTPDRHYIEVKSTEDPTKGGMLMVNKSEGIVETFISSDRFYDSVTVTLDMAVVGES